MFIWRKKKAPHGLPVSLPFCDISLSNTWLRIIINNNDSIVIESLVNGVLTAFFPVSGFVPSSLSESCHSTRMTVTSGDDSWHLHSKNEVCTQVHSGVIHNSQKRKQSKCPSMDEQINRNVVYTHNGTLASFFKMEGNSNTCYNRKQPEDIRLNEIRQTQKDKYHTTPPHVNYLEQESRFWDLVTGRSETELM